MIETTQACGAAVKRAVGGGFTSRHEVMTEERLDALERRFRMMRIQALTGARFEEYVAHPETLEDHVKQMTTERLASRRTFERRGGLQCL
jgi:hypothetical protein